MQQAMMGFLRDGVGLSQWTLTTGHDDRLGPKLMTNPADTDCLHLLDAVYSGKNRFNPLNQCRIDTVHQTSINGSGSSPKHSKNDDRNEQTHDRVSSGEPNGDADGSDDNGQGGDPVRACVEPIGNECC